MSFDGGVFDSKTPLTDDRLTAGEAQLLGFDARYRRIFNQLRLVFNADALEQWSKKHHHTKIPIIDLARDQYPLVIFHGDVGTGKTAIAEVTANRLVRETKATDSILYKLSNRVRGSGKVGEIGTLLSQALAEVTRSAGKARRAILVIDEGDSLGAARTQQHSHHEDKVAVNTLIQGIDEFRKTDGRILVFLCTNRFSALDAALVRRAAVVEEFSRPSAEERRALFEMDLKGVKLPSRGLEDLVEITGPRDGKPCWTYSDIRTRLYPAALALAFPASALQLSHFIEAAKTIAPSPVMQGL